MRDLHADGDQWDVDRCASNCSGNDEAFTGEAIAAMIIQCAYHGPCEGRVADRDIAVDPDRQSDCAERQVTECAVRFNLVRSAGL